MDKESISFHVRVGDYFGTIATLLDLLKQNSEKGLIKEDREAHLKRLSEELLYMQDNFEIVPKAQV